MPQASHQTELPLAQPRQPSGVGKSNGKILQGDCLAIMRQLQAESFKVIITSPPYNLLDSSSGGFRNKNSKWGKATLRDGYDGHADNMPPEKYVAWQRACLEEMMRLLREDGAIFYNHRWRSEGGLLKDRADIVAGFPVRQIIIWDKCSNLNQSRHFFAPSYEVIYFIAKPSFKLMPKSAGYGAVWRIPQETNNPHPAPFPIEIPLKCIAAAGGGPVLDPFLGSGTTAVAAERLGAKWTGIEKSAEYVKAAAERIRKAARA